MNKLFPLALAALCLTAPASAQWLIPAHHPRRPGKPHAGQHVPGLCPTTNPSACSTQPGPGQYNIQTTAWFDKTSPTKTTNPHAVPLGVGYDNFHTHSAFVAMCDLNANGACTMDGAAHVGCKVKSQPCPTKAAFGYVESSWVQPYLDLVKAYGWGNYMFQTNQGNSFPAHQFLFGATSAPSAEDDHKGIFAAERNNGVTGCISPSTTSVALINPQGVEFAQIYPCFEHPTVGDLLDARGVSWRYYGEPPATLLRRTPPVSGSRRMRSSTSVSRSVRNARARSGPGISSSPREPFCPTFLRTANCATSLGDAGRT